MLFLVYVYNMVISLHYEAIYIYIYIYIHRANTTMQYKVSFFTIQDHKNIMYNINKVLSPVQQEKCLVDNIIILAFYNTEVVLLHKVEDHFLHKS